MKGNFKNASHRVHRMFKVSVSSKHLTPECTENIAGTSPWSLCVVSVTLCEKFFAFLQPSGKLMNNPEQRILHLRHRRIWPKRFEIDGV